MSKPRPPKVNEENLKEAKSQTSPITKLKLRLETLEEEREKGNLTTTYIAFEAMGAIFNGIKEGYSYEDILEAYPVDWGSEQIILPSALIAPLVDVWSEYRATNCEKPLGEVLGLEGGGQGKSSAKKKLKTIIYHRNLAYRVETQYYKRAEIEPISLRKAIKNIALQEGITVDTVEKAHRKYYKNFRKELLDLEIIQ